MDWVPGLPNPFSWLAGEAGKVIVDGWTMAMLGLWNAGLWMLRLVLNIMDAFLTPDLSENGPGSQVYQYTFWIAGSLVVLMLMLQLAVAASKRDGKSIATALMGTGQFCLVWSTWVGGAVIVLAAAGGLTRALMVGLLKVNSWSAWKPFDTFNTKDITDGTVATVLGGMGCLLWLAAIGHLLVMLTRAGALLVLSTTTPISAAGLVANAGRAWFWKSLRWFIAAAFSPVIMVLVLGIGIQLTTGVASGMTDTTQAAIGTAVPAVILILISAFCPLALFKLLAFVDPGTTSGSALRAGLDAQGGLQGLFGGKGAGDEGSSAASSSDENGTSQGESSSEDATSGRFNKAEGGMLQKAGGALGGVAAAGLGAMQNVGSRGAAIGADLTNQMGIGHSNYYPDFSSGKQQSSASENPERHGGHDGDASGEGPNSTPANDPSGPSADPSTGQEPSQTGDPGQGPTNPGNATQGSDLPTLTPGGPPNTSPGAGGQGGQQGGGSNGGAPGGGAGGAGATGGASDAAVVAV
ncbi:MAG: hypothetical protein M3Y49_19370 [Actinomycetota bacterium]|nr:hypothetical protein [Actinomycetota bacterium]